MVVRERRDVLDAGAEGEDEEFDLGEDGDFDGAREMSSQAGDETI